MVIKNEEQRKFLLELMSQVQYPGSILEIAYAVKIEIQNATIEPDIKSAPKKEIKA